MDCSVAFFKQQREQLLWLFDSYTVYLVTRLPYAKRFLMCRKFSDQLVTFKIPVLFL